VGGGVPRGWGRGAPEGRGLVRLRAFADGYQTWLSRYQIQ